MRKLKLSAYDLRIVVRGGTYVGGERVSAVILALVNDDERCIVTQSVDECVRSIDIAARCKRVAVSLSSFYEDTYHVPEAAQILNVPLTAVEFSMSGYSCLMTPPSAVAASPPEGVIFSNCSVSFVIGEV